jgi:hypothetical protein
MRASRAAGTPNSPAIFSSEVPALGSISAVRRNSGPIYAFLRPAGSHRWTATRLPSGREPDLETCQATADGGGIVASIERSTAVNVAVVSPGGDVQLEQTIDDTGRERGGVTYPTLGVAPDGRAIVLWNAGYDSEDGRRAWCTTSLPTMAWPH